MNLKITRKGMTIKLGIGIKKLNELSHKGIMLDNIITRAQLLCAATSETRIFGSKLLVMSTVGSGNHGITVFLTSYVVIGKRNLSKEKLIRSLSLSNLITFLLNHTLIPYLRCVVVG